MRIVDSPCWATYFGHWNGKSDGVGVSWIDDTLEDDEVHGIYTGTGALNDIGRPLNMKSFLLHYRIMLTLERLLWSILINFVKT